MGDSKESAAIPWTRKRKTNFQESPAKRACVHVSPLVVRENMLPEKRHTFYVRIGNRVLEKPDLHWKEFSYDDLVLVVDALFAWFQGLPTTTPINDTVRSWSKEQVSEFVSRSGECRVVLPPKKLVDCSVRKVALNIPIEVQPMEIENEKENL